MALRKSFSFVASGITNTPIGNVSVAEINVSVVDAYIKVESVDGTKNNASAKVSIKSGNDIFISMHSFVPDMDGKNFIAQAYDYLKTLPEFAGAVDC